MPGIYYVIMIVAKFGGTAVTPNNIFRLKSLVTPRHGAVVVSAIGKQHSKDTKVTDLLLAYYNSGNTELLSKVLDKYQQLAYVTNTTFNRLECTQLATKYAQLSKPDALLSLGEAYAARIVSQLLGARYVEASQVIRVVGTGVDISQSCKQISKLVKPNLPIVTGGFYGADCQGNVVTLPRGGGDISGAVFARALNASLYQNWTDACGVCVTDPRLAYSKTLPNLSYNQMHFLAQHGATVLHPDCVSICQQSAIPIVVASYLMPHSPCTTVCNGSCRLPLLSVSEVFSNFYKTTVLHNMSQQLFVDKLNGFLSADCVREGVITELHLCSGLCFVASRQSIVKPLYYFLSSN